MDQIDTCEKLETKLKNSVKIRDQIRSLSKNKLYNFELRNLTWWIH